jgi:hypothetical protein
LYRATGVSRGIQYGFEHREAVAGNWPRRLAAGVRLKVRSRKFEGRCARHKRYNPAVDGRAGIRGACARCTLLCGIWESAIKLNQLIRKFDPNHDDGKRPAEAKGTVVDPRQLSLITD